jgi:Mrp family chromosome partitioning ATPase
VVLVAGVTVSGSRDGVAVSRLVTQLAASMAQAGKRVLIVEVGERRGRSPLRSPAPEEDPDRLPRHPLGPVQVAEIGEGVHLLPAAPDADSRSGWPQRPELGQGLRSWSQAYDLVLLDTPPLLDQAQGLALGQHADGVLLVVNAGRTPLSALRRVMRSLAAVDLPLVGCVLNQSSAPRQPTVSPARPPARSVTEARTGETR